MFQYLLPPDGADALIARVAGQRGVTDCRGPFKEDNLACPVNPSELPSADDIIVAKTTCVSRDTRTTDFAEAILGGHHPDA